VSAGTAVPTPTQELYLQFWSQFEPLAKQRGWTNASAPAQNWWSMPTGVTGATWSVSYAMFGCRSELFFGHPDPAVNLARWQVLHDRGNEIRAAFGEGLVFDELLNAKGCRIETKLNGPKIGDRQKWPEVVTWMLDTQTRMRHAVSLVGGVPNATALTAGAAVEGQVSIASHDPASDPNDSAST
jgi:Domain of unknown function (DUF4268)